MPTVTTRQELPLFDAEDPSALTRASEQLARFGHVAFAGGFATELADRASNQVDELFPPRRWHVIGGREEAAVRAGLELPRDDSGLGAIRAILIGSAQARGGKHALGNGAHPQDFDQVIRLQPGQRSSSQTLRESRGPVLAAATLEGEAELVIGQRYYSLEPGAFALVDGQQHSFHERAVGSTAWLGYFATQQAPDHPWL